MKPRSLRLRLTLFVTALFALTVTTIGLLARNQLANTLENDVAANADALLSNYFDTTAADRQSTINSSVARFVYLDADGSELPANEVSQLIGAALLAEMPDSIIRPSPPAGQPTMDDVEVGRIIVGTERVAPFEAIGPSQTTDLGPDTIAVARPVTIAETKLWIGVSQPRQPIDDTLRAVTTALIVLIPLLSALVAAATWVTVSRALRPVEAIRRQVERTDPSHLDHHVPQPGGGDEIDRLAGTMNDMLDRLHLASQRQHRFISDASHELRSPITATLATIETSSADDATNRWPEISRTIQAEQVRLAQLVDDLLLLAKLDETGAGIEPIVSVDLDELAIAEARRTRKQPVHPVIDSPQRIDGNARLLQRCLSNIVDNAARHATSRVEVSVGATSENRPFIRVDDDGPGIAEHQVPSIFDRFTRLDDARNRRDGGAGLGLAIAKEIAAKHRASLTAGASPLGGARFELIFERLGGGGP